MRFYGFGGLYIAAVILCVGTGVAMAKKDIALKKKSHPQATESVATKKARKQFHKYILEFANCVEKSKAKFSSLSGFEVPTPKSIASRGFSYDWELSGFYKWGNMRGTTKFQKKETMWARLEEEDPKAHVGEQMAFSAPPPGPRILLDGKKYFINTVIWTDNLDLRKFIVECHDVAITSVFGAWKAEDGN